MKDKLIWDSFQDNVEYPMKTQKRQIKINSNWYNIGDTLLLEEPLYFLFWYLPIKIKRKYIQAPRKTPQKRHACRSQKSS